MPRLLGKGSLGISIGIIGLLVGSIWYPVLSHYYVTAESPSHELVRALRTTPSDEYLQNKAIVQAFFSSPVRVDADLTRGTERLVQDEAALVGLQSELQANLSSDLFARGLSDLGFASLSIADIYIRGYEATRRLELLGKAASFIAAFSEYERDRWLPIGFLWNDHAIAARVGVLARFWRSYRSSAVYDDAIAAEVLWHARRCAAFLADEDHFTYATNHGVMQNLALLQFAAAFPSFDESQTYAALAARRLGRQFRYYLSDEGVVLEHSAGYHAAGVRFLDMAIELTKLNDLEIPPVWKEKYRKAIRFLRILTRPDGTLPMLGDTHSTPLGEDFATYPGSGSVTGNAVLFPVSGYAVWWAASADELAQSAVTWSHFPGHGHRTADEMSLLIWARGSPWITNIGYWPYSAGYRDLATGWAGGNAPHWQHESAAAERRTVLERSAAGSDVVALDLERTDQFGRTLSRQIVALAGRSWIVLDTQVSAGAESSETLWTFWPGLVLTEPGRNLAIVEDPVTQTALNVTILGGPGVEIGRYAGSLRPFAGWVVRSGRPVPAPSLLVTRPAGDNWSVAMFSFGRAPEPATFERISETNWEASGAHDGKPWKVQRNGQRVTAYLNGERADIILEESSDVTRERQTLESALTEVAQEFGPRYRDLDLYRRRLTLFIVFGLLVQEATLFSIWTFAAPRWPIACFRAMALVPWTIIAIWAHLIYLT